jgi:hypothetical protein
MGHSTGGLFAQMLAGRGLSAATIAIDPGVFRGVLPLPLSTLRATGPFLLNPRYRGRAITLTFDQFRRLDERPRRGRSEASLRHLRGRVRDRPGADGQRQPQPLDRVEGRHEEPRTGPAADRRRGERHTVPWAIAKAAYKRQKRHPSVTEIRASNCLPLGCHRVPTRAAQIDSGIELVDVDVDDPMQTSTSCSLVGVPPAERQIEAGLARLGRDEPLDEVERGLRGLLPAVVDGQRVAAVGHLLAPAFRRNTAERAYRIEAAHNPEVAGSDPAPATTRGAERVPLVSHRRPVVTRLLRGSPTDRERPSARECRVRRT